MSETHFEIGSEVFHGNSRYRVIGVLDLEHVSVRSSFTGTVKKMHVSELTSKPDDPEKPVEIVPATDLLTIPDEDWVKVNNKAMLFNQVLQINDEAERRVQLREVANKLEISEPTAYRQLQKYKNSNGNPLSLLRKKRNETGRLQPEVEDLIQKYIGVYLSPIQPRVTNIYRDLKLEIYEINKERKNSNLELLVTPHINTLRFRISQLTASEVASKRKGRKGREDFRPLIGKFPQSQKPLEVVQIDHTPLDLIIVDDENRLDIGRPTITLAIDAYSRMVVGFYISLEKPNTLLTGLCLAHAILDKKQWLLEHEVEGDWPAYGLMDTIHTDNGKEFHGKSLKRACEIYKLNMIKRPAKTPRYGPHIERSFKTFNDSEIHTLPGTTKSNVQDKAEYQSEDNAIFTLFEFEQYFTEFLVNNYHLEKHSDLGMSPLQKYKQGILGNGEQLGRGLPPKIDDPLKLKIDFLPYEERSVQKYGIQLFGIDYFHDVLRKWIKQPDKNRKGSQRFIVRYDPRDLSSVFFFDPDMKAYVVVPYRDTSHPPISLWELRELKRKAKEADPYKSVDEEAIFESRARMKRLTEQALKQTKHMRRMKQKEAIREKESIPSIAKESARNNQNSISLVTPSINDFDDEDFEDIQPFEELDQ
ncbi:Transposon Tn7 transposition protein TnsB [Hydrogenovibrio crunogenus]|uniref:Transposon Tn7 transposition protein TnsB n=1 Tax=Hydrogenovibrio crunogenus TaxID=39765 RepID=A0A4P7NWY5_9GAMM|nr:Mu transposase C-terminal domain-containing protein [Hydrogenovibrio crunogenus]QBZ82187.1 Transposon Tn7 transposition protein TnsB [Hydrogenovibrio crunogenus]